MKNDFCRLSEKEINELAISDDLKGLLLSPFQMNDDGKWVTIPRETFQEFTDAATQLALSVHQSTLD